jgi:hypothetical protein
MLECNNEIYLIVREVVEFAMNHISLRLLPKSLLSIPSEVVMVVVLLETTFCDIPLPLVERHMSLRGMVLAVSQQ